MGIKTHARFEGSGPYQSHMFVHSGRNLPEINVDMTGKTCLITGGNSGVGKATPLGLAGMGGNVVGGFRDRGKSEAALNQVFRKRGNRNVYVMLADIASYGSIPT